MYDLFFSYIQRMFSDHSLMSHTSGHRSPTIPVSIMSGPSGALSRQQTELTCTEPQPTGGCTAGKKTPRHVQWASRDDMHVSMGSAASPRLSIHALDEMGLDVRVNSKCTHLINRNFSQELSRPSVGLLNATNLRPSAPEAMQAAGLNHSNFDTARYLSLDHSLRIQPLHHPLMTVCPTHVLTNDLS